MAETCLWLLHNKPTFTRSSAFVGIFKNIVYLLHCVIFTYCMSHLLHLGTSLEDFDTVKSFELCYFIITCISYVIRIVCCANVTVLIIIVVFFIYFSAHFKNISKFGHLERESTEYDVADLCVTAHLSRQ